MATLRKVEIKGFRSIKETALELGSLNVFIGANGAGKSNFVEFFKMLRQLLLGHLREFIGSRGGAQSILYFGPKVTPELEGLLEFTVDEEVASYSFRLTHAINNTLIFAEEACSLQNSAHRTQSPLTLGAGHSESRIEDFVIAGNASVKQIQSLLNSCRGYHFHDTSATAGIRQPAPIHDNRQLRADGGNLAAVLYAIQQRHPATYRRIVSTIRKIMPDFDDFELKPSRLNPSGISLNWRSHRADYLFDADQISDGSLRAMAIIFLLLQPEEDLPGVIILDEPELGLHPHALEIVAGLMRAASMRTQVIVATQSQTFLNFFDPEEIITVDAFKNESVFRRLNSDDFQEWLEDYTIGELWQRNVLGGGPLP